jgi:hypothetical protein
MGRRNIPSMMLLNLPWYLAIQRATAIPRKKVITVAARTVLTDIQIGDKNVSAMCRLLLQLFRTIW